MKRIIIVSIILGVLHAILNFIAHTYTLDYAIIPKFMVPASCLNSLLRRMPAFVGIALVFIGCVLFFYSMYILVMNIFKRTKSWWKSFYYILIISIILGFAFLSVSLMIYKEFYPPVNLAIIGTIIFSTILLFPIKEIKHLIANYIVYFVAYIMYFETYRYGIYLGFQWILYLSPLYVVLMYLLTYQFTSNRKMYYFLIIIVLFIPLRMKWIKPHGILKDQRRTVEYTIIAPSIDFFEVKEFELPFENSLSYISILEIDSAYHETKTIFGNRYLPFVYFERNLNENRVERIKDLVSGKNVYVGKLWREQIDKRILYRWEMESERGVISGQLTGDIPDKVAILSAEREMGIWNSTFLLKNLKDSVSPNKEGNFLFGYVPKGNYQLLFLFKRKVPAYQIKIPLIASENDTIDLGIIKIE